MPVLFDRGTNYTVSAVLIGFYQMSRVEAPASEAFMKHLCLPMIRKTRVRPRKVLRAEGLFDVRADQVPHDPEINRDHSRVPFRADQTEARQSQKQSHDRAHST